MTRTGLLDACRLSCRVSTVMSLFDVSETTARRALVTQSSAGLLKRHRMGSNGSDIWILTEAGERFIDEERAREVCRG